MTEGPLAWLHPFDSGPLHSFSSGLDGDLLGLPPSNCGVAAKMAFNELAALDLLRTPSGFDQRVADAPPPETSRRVTGADATSAGGEKPFAFDAQRVAAGVPSTSYEPAEVRRRLIRSPWFLDLPSFTPYRRFQRRTRAFAGGTLTSQSTDVFFRFLLHRPQVFSPVNFGDVDVAETFFSKVRILTRVPTHPFARFALTFPHRRARGRPNHAKLGKHVTSLFPRVP